MAEKIITILDNKKTYNPSLSENILPGGIKNALLSNLNKKLQTQKGYYLIYGK